MHTAYRRSRFVFAITAPFGEGKETNSERRLCRRYDSLRSN